MEWIKFSKKKPKKNQHILLKIDNEILTKSKIKADGLDENMSGEELCKYYTEKVSESRIFWAQFPEKGNK